MANTVGILDKVMDSITLKQYEKTIEEINSFYADFISEYDSYSSELLASRNDGYKRRLLTLEKSLPILESIGFDKEIYASFYKKLSNFALFERHLSEIYPNLLGEPFDKKISYIKGKIDEEDVKLLNYDFAFDLFTLCTLFDEEYLNKYQSIIMPLMSKYEKQHKKKESFIKALQESKLNISISEMIEKISHFSMVFNIDFSANVKIVEPDIKQFEFFANKATELKHEFVSNFKKVLSQQNATFLLPINNFEEYLKSNYPRLEHKNFDQKLEILAKLNSEGKLDDETFVKLFSACTQVSLEYRNKYKEIRSELLSGNINYSSIANLLKEKNIGFDELAQAVRRYRDFFTKGFSDDQVQCFNELKELNIIKISDYKEQVDEILKGLLPKAYALVKAAIKEAKGIEAYDVQLMGAIALNDECIAEMYTGEGKSLTALFSAFLNSLTGEEIDIFTPNDYLSERDSENARSILGMLDLNVGCVLAGSQKIEDKRKAYRSDIVYGSSSAFAFDYINDTFKSNENQIAQRKTKPYYAIIDEADVALVDEALDPFAIKTNQSLGETYSVENEEIKSDLLTAFEYAKILLKSQYKGPNSYESKEGNLTLTRVTDDFLRKVTGGDLTRMLGLKQGTDEEIDEYEDIQNNYYVILGNKEAAITALGSAAIFSLMKEKEINDLTERLKSYFLDSEKYDRGYDYRVLGDRVVLTPKGLLKATSDIKEYHDLEKEWLHDPKSHTIRSCVYNQLIAFAMKKGKNAEYDVDEEKEEIVLLEAGREKEFSKFQRGLHQALELKEFGKIKLAENERLMDSYSDTITMNMLLHRYGKISGMTGTADKELFSSIYYMDTIAIPRNKTYQYKKGNTTVPPKEVVERPYVLYKTNDGKLDAIVDEIRRSHALGQPVLMVTDSNDEAEKIYEKLAVYGLKTEAKLLTSREINKDESKDDIDEERELKKAKNEAKIVSNAGRVGAITIASEMAGRGTDIRLLPDSEDARKLALENVLREIAIRKAYKEQGRSHLKLFEEFKQDCFDSPEIIKNVLNQISDNYINDPEFKGKVDVLVEKEADVILSNQQSMGLKLIQAKPLKTTRHDRQVRGRVGRQGEAGEIVLFTSLDDLNDIGVSDEATKELLDRAFENADYVDDSSIDEAISEIIEKAQINTELSEDRVIASSSGVDFVINSVSSHFLNTRAQLLRTNDLSYTLDHLVLSTLDTILSENLPESKRKKFANGKKVKLKKLDVENTLRTMNDIFGVNISEPDVLEECSTVNDLMEFAKGIINRKLNDVKSTDGSFDFDVKTKLSEMLSSTYDKFMYSVESVKEQEFSDQIAQNNKHDRSSDVVSIYKEALRDFRYSSIKSIFNTDIKILGANENSEPVEIIDEDFDDTDYISIEDIEKSKEEDQTETLDRLALKKEDDSAQRSLSDASTERRIIPPREGEENIGEILDRLALEKEDDSAQRSLSDASTERRIIPPREEEEDLGELFDRLGSKKR